MSSKAPGSEVPALSPLPQQIVSAGGATVVSPFGTSIFWTKAIIQLIGLGVGLVGLLAMFGVVKVADVSNATMIANSPLVAGGIAMLAGLLAVVAPEVSAHLSHGIQNQNVGS